MKATLAALLLLSSFAQAKDLKPHQSGTLLQMESAECGSDQKTANSVAGEVLGTDSSHQKTRSLLCPEYVLQTDDMVYHIRPKDDKHPRLLPIGQRAEFRLDKDKMKLRVEDLDDKERDYTVVSMTPR